MSSLKMTFSLTSLILIMAFVAMPVMAHEDTTPATAHNHPVADARIVTDLNGDGDTIDAGEGAVDAHNFHPQVSSIVAKPDAADATLETSQGRNVILLASDGTGTALTLDGAAGGIFTVVITYDRELSADGDDLTNGEVSVRVRRSDGTTVTGIDDGAITAIDATATTPRKFEVVIDVPTSAYWDADATPPAHTLPIEVFVDVVAAAVSGESTVDANGKTLPSAESYAYESNASTKFTIVDAITPRPPPAGKIVTIVPGSGITATGAGMASVGPGSSSLVFNLTTAAAADGKPTIMGMVNGGAELSDTDYLITGSGTAWTLTIVRGIGTREVVITAGTGFEFHHAYPASATAAKVANFTVTVDRVGPTVMSIVESAGVLPTAGGAFQITVTFSETLSRMPVASDFTVTNGAITAPFSQVSPKVFTTTLTPAHGVVGTNTDATMQSVDIRLNAGLTDAFGNSSVATAATATADKSFMPLAATAAVVTVPGMPTGLTATANQEANTITLTWEAVSGAATYTVTKNYTTTDGTPATPVVKSGITGTTLTIPGANDDALPQGVPFTFTVTATNSAGTSAASEPATATITMDDVAPPLAFSSALAPQTFIAGITLTPDLQLPYATGGSPPYKYSLHKGVGKLDITADGDNGLTVDLANLRVSGTPVATDTSGTSYTWRVTDDNGEGSSLDLPFIIIVNPPGPNIAPVVAFETQVPAAGQTGSFAIVYTATDADADTLTEVVTHTTAPVTADTFYTVTHDAMNEMVTITQTTPTVTTPSIPAAVVTVTITANDGTTDSTPMTFRVEFAAAIYDLGAPRDTTYPVVAVVPVVGDQSAAFDVTFTVIEANLATGGVTAAITPAEAVEDAALVATLVSGNTYKVTVTPKMPTATTTSVAAATITITVTATDVAGNASSQVIAVNLAARTYTPPPAGDTTAPEVAVTPVVGAQSAAFDVTITATDDMDTLTAADISVTVTSSNPGAATYTVSAVTADAAANTYKVTITPTAATTADIAAETLTVSVTVTDAASHSASQSIAVALAARSMTPTPITPTVTDSANILSGFSIPAETHVVIARSDVIGLPSGVTLITWNGMPDLEGLLFDGGTLSLTRDKTPKVDHDADDADADGKKDADATKDASAARDIGARDVVITEVMAALNTAVVGTDTETAHQWIEVYNKLKVDVSGLTLSAKAGRPPGVATGAPDPTATDSTEVLVDRLSNVVGGGWAFSGLGANGFTDNNPETTNTYFVSFYRNHRGEPGWQKNRWTTSTEVYLAGYKGSPGAKERAGAKTFTKSGVGLKTVFNEVGNYDNADHEWIELMVREGTPNFENWQVSIVTAVGTDDEVFTLPKIDKYSFAAGDVLLITDSDPKGVDNHPLAAGYNVTVKAADQDKEGRDANILYIVREFKKELPDSGDFVLILRHGKDKRKTHEKIEDVAGRATTSLTKSDTTIHTDLWPLIAHGAANRDNNKLNKGVHRRQHADIIGTGTKDANKEDKTAFRGVGWTGIGYKRNAAAIAGNGGTPGYPNGSLKGNNDANAIAAVMISEVMASNGARNLPDWIELQNVSDAVGVNLDGWRVTITNHNDDGAGGEYDGKLTHTINIGGRLPVGQHYLIAAYPGRNDTNLPKERIKDAGLDKGDSLINPHGFQIKLEAKKDSNYFHVDTVGNLGAAPATSRRGDAQSFEPLAWELPVQMDEDGERISLVRAKGAAGVAVDDGTMKGALIRFDMSSQIDRTLDETDYGHNSDTGSPGHHPGGVLPVSLSKFRPERMKDTGAVVIRWITESETNNAGFNILRSEKRDGEFTKLNTKLIAGQGTTSERTTYEYADTSAKPNVVYYYQIQDVSLDGQVQTLRTTHLRGNVTAAGKLTTTWGELKALQ